MAESPKEVKAEQGHPAEHGDAGEVEQIANDEASIVGDTEEELSIIFDSCHVVGDHDEGCCQKDGQEVGTNDLALK